MGSAPSLLPTPYSLLLQNLGQKHLTELRNVISGKSFGLNQARARHVFIK